MKTVTALACALLLAACGSSKPSSSGSSGDDRDTARLKLQECLRKEGLQPPERGDGPRRATAAEARKFEKAVQGPCKQYAQGAFGEMSAEQRQEREDQFAKFASCMRKNGVDLPDIRPGEGAPPGVQRLNRNSAAFKRAVEACEDLRPEGGPGGGDRVVGQAPS